ncbi:CPBP family intramembrane glutamic endopeptidase [Leeuwenhoekiella parthenopeia]|uniref:CPBP family intramembrane metalloprotease n=1 Tax=Leeuwenhoekiella parthenopeia TaxID=2890320 RepID=A0ABS8GUN7_9FLAO|nr:CPBP family intramembrane glutamic endopeptidase [Leeuwenhoekiella parthenopeia]MCC4213370.1 CPBP family intramembrane metalloprotease [Leeuwenhoekiella parthenopeia]
MSFASRVGIINEFIKRPDDRVLPLSFWQKIKFLFSSIVYDMAIAIGFVVLLTFLEPLTAEYENLLNKDLYPFWQAILYMTILPPLIEETIFRFPLKYKRNYLLRGLAYLFKTDFSVFWRKHLRVIVYLFSSVFGLVHLSNYENVDWIFFVLAPIITGPQLAAGVIFSFLRLKLGFVWALLGHFLHNFSLIMLSFLAFHNVERPLVDNEQVSIETTGIAFEVERSTRMVYDSAPNGNLLCLEAQNYELQNLIDHFYTKDSIQVRDNDRLDLKLYSKTDEGYSREDLLEVLEGHYTLIKPTSDN